MTAEESNAAATFGFISVIESAEDGLFGGYLVLNTQGRPLEFHCTAPVQANRAQEILYGATLAPFLYGEQIGQTLMAAAKRKARVVCTDMLPVLALQPLTDIPVVWVADRLPIEGLAAACSLEPRELVTPADTSLFPILGPLHPFACDDHALLVSESMRDQQAEICDQLAPLLELLELTEPFTRIQAAIEEAHRTALGEPPYRQAG